MEVKHIRKRRIGFIARLKMAFRVLCLNEFDSLVLEPYHIMYSKLIPKYPCSRCEKNPQEYCISRTTACFRIEEHGCYHVCSECLKTKLGKKE